MNAVDRHLADLAGALRVRGRMRSRFLAECRDHLADASMARGPDEAVRQFGPVADAVRGFEVEVAVRRARTATLLASAGVLAMGASTLVMVHAASRGLAAPLAWTVVFFASAQTSAVAMALALLRAAAMRHEVGNAASVALLCRRSWVALGFASLTMFATGAAVPGHADAWRILAGPAVALLAALALVRAGRMARRHRLPDESALGTPVADLLSLAQPSPTMRFPRWIERPGVLLAAALLMSTAAAFWWGSMDDHGTARDGAAAAGIEVVCVLLGFTVLGRALGLYSRRARGNMEPADDRR